MIALSNYHQNPYDMDCSKITFEEVYQKWSAELQIQQFPDPYTGINQHEDNRHIFICVLPLPDGFNFPKISESNVKGYAASYLLCAQLYKMRFVDVLDAVTSNHFSDRLTFSFFRSSSSPILTPEYCKYLLSTPEGKHFIYRNYYDSYWMPLIEQMGMNHRPHDTRQ